MVVAVTEAWHRRETVERGLYGNSIGSLRSGEEELGVAVTSNLGVQIESVVDLLRMRCRRQGKQAA